jgi:hypothetical protein
VAVGGMVEQWLEADDDGLPDLLTELLRAHQIAKPGERRRVAVESARPPPTQSACRAVVDRLGKRTSCARTWWINLCAIGSLPWLSGAAIRRASRTNVPTVSRLWTRSGDLIAPQTERSVVILADFVVTSRSVPRPDHYQIPRSRSGGG